MGYKLTSEEKENIINRFVEVIEGSYIRKQVIGAETRAEAIKIAKSNGYGGWGITGELVMGSSKGIEIREYNGAEIDESISWGEFVDYLRGESIQGSLF